MIGSSMCSPMSAKSMIASVLRAISRGDRPMSAPERSMFSRPGVFLVEAAAELQERADAPVDGDRAGRGPRHAGDDLEERRLAGAVLADEAHGLAAAHLEVDRVERAETGHVAAADEERGERAQPVAARGDLREILGDALQSDEAVGLAQVFVSGRDCRLSWYRERDSNPHSVATGGF